MQMGLYCPRQSPKAEGNFEQEGDDEIEEGDKKREVPTKLRGP